MRLDAKRIGALWKAMAALGQRYSSVEVGNTSRPLDPKKPLAHVVALATKRAGWRNVVFETHLRVLAGAAEAKALGYDFLAVVTAILGPTLSTLGLSLVAGPNPLDLQFRGGHRGLVLGIDPTGEFGVEACLESWTEVSATWPSVGTGPTCSWPAKGTVLEKQRPVKKKDVETYLRALAPRLEKKGLAFFTKYGI